MAYTYTVFASYDPPAVEEHLIGVFSNLSDLKQLLLSSPTISFSEYGRDDGYECIDVYRHSLDVFEYNSIWVLSVDRDLREDDQWVSAVTFQAVEVK